MTLRVVVWGAGLSGLVAAIHLARRGRDVEVREMLKIPGGLAASRPAAHATMTSPAALERYVGIPIRACFERVERELTVLEDRPVNLRPRHWNCLRGDREGALDTALLDAAQRTGVRIRWSTRLGVDGGPLNEPDTRHIVATGLGRFGYQRMGLPVETIHGYVAHAPWDGPTTLVTFRNRHMRPDYAYVATHGDVVSGFVFGRDREVSADSLRRFEDDVAAHLGVELTSWKPVRGLVPRVTRLTSGDTVLAGTVGGVIDPFYLSGVGGALVSGVIAALAIVDPEGAAAEHRRRTRTFGVKRYLRARFSARRATLPTRAALVLLDRLVPTVGTPGRTPPLGP